jgi:hypothetical protein
MQREDASAAAHERLQDGRLRLVRDQIAGEQHQAPIAVEIANVVEIAGASGAEGLILGQDVQHLEARQIEIMEAAAADHVNTRHVGQMPPLRFKLPAASGLSPRIDAR